MTPTLRTAVLAAFLAFAACSAPAPGPSGAGTEVLAAPAPGAADDVAGITYTGRVVDRSGRPLAGAVAFADNGVPYQTCRIIDELPWRSWAPDPLSRANLGPATRRAAAASGPDGRFRVEGVAPPAGGWVRIASPDHVPSRVAVAPGMVRGDVVDVGDVVLDPGASLAVRVVDASGRPVPGASVVARPGLHDPSDAPGGAGVIDEEDAGEVKVATTSASGDALLRGLRRRTYRVGAFTETCPPSVDLVRVGGDGGEDDGAGRVAAPSAEIRLSEGHRVRVEVRWRGTGDAVAGARVRLLPPGYGTSFPGPSPLADARTGGDGTALFEGLEREAGEIVASVIPPDFAGDAVHSPGPFSVGVAVAADDVRVELDRPHGLRVEFVDAATRAPIPGGRVKLWPDWDRYDRTGGAPIDVTAHDATGSGRCEIPAARAGIWHIDAFAPGYLPVSLRGVAHGVAGDSQATVRCSADVPLVVSMKKAAVRSFGRVVARTGGAPLAGASVESYEWVERMGEGNRVAATTDADGCYRLDGCLGDGFPIRVEARAPGYVPGTAEVPADQRVRALQSDDGTQVPEIALWRAGAVRGRIVGSDGRPRPHASVALLQGDGRRRSKMEYAYTGAADAAGRFAFEDLPPGTYTIDIGLSVAKTPPSATVTIAEGEVVERELVGE